MNCSCTCPVLLRDNRNFASQECVICTVRGERFFKDLVNIYLIVSYSSLVFHSFQNLIIKPIHYRFYHWFHQSMAKIELNSVLIVEHRAFLLSMLKILPLILGEIVSRSEWDVCRRTVNRSEFPSIHYTMMSCHNAIIKLLSVLIVEHRAFLLSVTDFTTDSRQNCV